MAEFTRLLTDPEVTRYIVVHPPFSPQDLAELSAWTLAQWERNGFGAWAAIEKATGRWVGRTGRLTRERNGSQRIVPRSP
jgi:RimJ/RimL family protein N-acetyltransferase